MMSVSDGELEYTSLNDSAVLKPPDLIAQSGTSAVHNNGFLLSALKSLIERRGGLWIENFEKVVENVPKHSTLSRQICRHGMLGPPSF